MLQWFKCPDSQITEVKDCLNKCRMGERCLTLPTLTVLSTEREWNGIASTTQLLNGTMMEFLKLTQPYVTDPDSRAFMLAGIKHHEVLEDAAKALGLPAEVALNIDRDIFDLLEEENGDLILSDYKNWGSFRVAKALGIVETGKAPHPTETYKKSGYWGKAGTPKMVPVFQRMPQEADNWEAEMQLNRYRVMLEDRGVPIKKMRVQVTVRDGGLAVARSRGIERNTCMIAIPEIDNEEILEYFDSKATDLTKALADGKWDIPCDEKENWQGVRCSRFCDVARNCPKGLLAQTGE